MIKPPAMGNIRIFKAGCLALAVGALLPMWGWGAELELIPETDWATPGRPLTVAIRIPVPEAWHTYWINSGDVGAPPSFQWRLSEGLEWAGPLQFPAPRRFEDAGLVSFGHESPLVLLATFRVQAPVGSELRIEVAADWLICRDLCVPASGRAEMTLPLRAEPAPATARHKALFARARAALPRPATGWAFEYRLADDYGLLHVTPPADAGPFDGTTAHFFPVLPGLSEPGRPVEWKRSGAGWTLKFVRGPASTPEPADVEGVLTFPGKSGIDALWVIARPRPAPPRPSAAPGDPSR